MRNPGTQLARITQGLMVAGIGADLDTRWGRKACRVGRHGHISGRPPGPCPWEHRPAHAQSSLGFGAFVDDAQHLGQQIPHRRGFRRAAVICHAAHPVQVHARLGMRVLRRASTTARIGALADLEDGGDLGNRRIALKALPDGRPEPA